jgi:hypothetical protein
MNSNNDLRTDRSWLREVLQVFVGNRLRLMLLFAFGLQFMSNDAVAQDPSCQKNCGWGMEHSSGTRIDCGSVDGCKWTLCWNHLEGCGFPDTHNDRCGMPILCDNGGC